MDGLRVGCAGALAALAARDGPPAVALLSLPGVLAAGVTFAGRSVRRSGGGGRGEPPPAARPPAGLTGRANPARPLRARPAAWYDR